MNKTAIRTLVILAIGAALAVGAVAYKSRQKSDLGTRLLAEVRADLGAIEVDTRSRAYIDALAARYHDDAYTASFGPDAPQIGGTTDVNAYQRALLTAMIGHAKGDGSQDIALALEKFMAAATKLDLTDD
jgi:hypothetical protein